MPILSHIGRRHWTTRIIVGIIYVLLIAGAATMVYPFLLMVAGSSKSSVDVADQRVVPAFLKDDRALYRKHVEGLFNESINQMRWTYGVDTPTFMVAEPPSGSDAHLISDWREFLRVAELPGYAFEIGYLAAPQSRGTIPSSLREFKSRMSVKCRDDIQRLNGEFGTTFPGWNAFFVLPKNGLERRVKGGNSPFDKSVTEFARGQPLENRYYFCAEGFFKSAFLKNVYTRDLAAYNRIHGTNHGTWNEIHLECRMPDPARYAELEREDWERFVRSILSLVWIKADAGAAPGYRDFLRAKYGDVATFNHRYGMSVSAFDVVPFPLRAPGGGVALSDWESYLQGWRDPTTGDMMSLPAEYLSVDTVEFRFRDWLDKKYGSVAVFNAGAPAPIRSWMDILPPQREFHYQAFLSQMTDLRKEFITRNYRAVADYVLRHGRAVVNTAVYCGLSVLCALIFNPLAAYALSRYRPRSTYKLLMFLMLTMAFPPMVTQIPIFLMLRQFHLLNSFAALILPGLANGYTIFLLKGFFDSLPRELYESAQFDGAGEFRLFWQFTMRLSTPILAVTALGAFTAAYTNFMMALLLCQDEKMWTIMPWLYQLQATSGQGVVFASLIIASVPTLLVFIFCQKIIMRGIVVPVEK